jgi:cyclic di-GMP phosphodiesterase Gmr
MQSRRQHYNAGTEGDSAFAGDTELNILRDVFKMLPAGVTVQDEHGRFLLVNDAAAVQLGIAASEPAASKELDQRREAGLELLRSAAWRSRRNA